MELVSIIIPTYNGSESISRTIKSALNQTYPNIEVIVVDDNGKGTEEQIATQKEVAEYMHLSNFHYICHEKNINGSAARNTGVRASKGIYIALLDDDDIFTLNKIELQINSLLKKNPDYAVSYTSYENIFKDGRRRVIKASESGDLCLKLLKNEVSILSSILLVRKDAWDYVQGFDESFKRNQDQEFCVRLFKEFKVDVVKDVCMKRYVLKRNIPSDVHKGVEYRYYFIKKMEYIINTYTEHEKKQIYSAFYTDIAKRYLKAMEFSKSFKAIFKTRTPIRTTAHLLNDFLSYRKNKKDNVLR